jgi:hypothetical protein
MKVTDMHDRHDVTVPLLKRFCDGRFASDAAAVTEMKTPPEPRSGWTCSLGVLKYKALSGIVF